jgi:long-chain acyl-CoA synthetase
MNVPRDVSQLVRRACASAPQRPAVVARSGSLTYAELDARANRAARALRELGVERGDRIAVCLPNDLDIVIAFHGAMRLGAIWVGVGQALAPPEKAAILRDSGASLALCDEPTIADLEHARDTLPELRTALGIGLASGSAWRQAVSAQADRALDGDIDPRAPAAIAYTSGTTGRPKGVVHSQRNLLLPGASLVATRRYVPDLRKGDCLPLTILNMMVLTTLLTAQAEATAVVMDRLDARSIARWIRRERVNVWNGPPPVLYTMAKDPEIAREDLDSLTEVWSGGAECPEMTRSAFEAKFSVPIYATYGLTEAPTVVTIEPLNEPHVPRSSGRPLPHLDVTIRDASGATPAPGVVGDICVGPRAAADGADRLEPAYEPMLGYWGKRHEGDAALIDGVLRTGDIGTFDPDGNLIVADRKTLVVNRGGANVYPAEVERVVLECHGVEACGVFGVPDERLGQRVGMLVQLTPESGDGLAVLVGHCRERLARYKVPELIAEVEALPRNAMGKLDRRALAELGQRLLAG